MKMNVNRTSDLELNRIYEEYLHRIEDIASILAGQKHNLKGPDKCYDMERNDTPSKDEAIDAFFQWNCAIVTAFRGRKELTPEENFNLNVAHNAILKSNMIEDGLMFRPVNGCYKEAHWEKESTEICFFVTNTGKDEQSGMSMEEQRRNFFFKMYRHAETWEQDSFLFTYPGYNRVAFLIATNDNGRKEFRGDIKFAGPLYELQEDEYGGWTDFSDGRLSFRLTGMLQYGGIHPKVKIGEGNIFDTESYQPDGIAVICLNEQKDLKKSCNHYKGDVPLVKRYFIRANQTAEEIQEKVWSTLNELIKDKAIAKKKKFTIGFHCTASIDDSSVKASKVVIEAVKEWTGQKQVKQRLSRIVLVDIFGDYSKVLDRS